MAMVNMCAVHHRAVRMVVMNDRAMRCMARHGAMVNMAQMKCQMLATREAEECPC
ncbi:MAG: hypothetical protein IKJ29_06030 [Akkermansia sp.]|nr:hypothetical protein [Akkermansia sp.]